MKFKGNRYVTFRPNYELRQLVVWAAALLYFRFMGEVKGQPVLACLCECVCALMILTRIVPAGRIMMHTFRLAGSSLTFVSFEDLRRKLAGHASDQWLGEGFRWEPRHAQLASEMLARDWQSVEREALGWMYPWRFFVKHPLKCIGTPFEALRLYREQQKRIAAEQGVKWIHGLGGGDDDIYQPLAHVEGHTLIVGTTGSGKTRCFDLLISQAILRGEAIFIVDPKGDADLKNKARRACEKLGRGDKFLAFHPAFPEESVHINPLANWTRYSEVADRISALLPGSGDASSFKNFSFQALNATSYALCMCSKRPSLKLLKHYISGTGSGAASITPLVFEALRRYLREKNPPVAEMFKDIDPVKCTPKILDKMTHDMVSAYMTAGPHDPDMDDLISQFTHNAEHFSKMITSLLPILSMLTSGPLGDLLSPPEDGDGVQENLFVDTKSLVNNKNIVYIGLDSLSDAMVGSAIGALILSDLACTAGARYNFGTADTAEQAELENEQTRRSGFFAKSVKTPALSSVSIFVDEAAEVVCTPFLQILNKGRGAGLRLFVATQTIADFSSKMGSKDKAMQLLGNLNNRISLRCIDLDTQKYVASLMPKTRIAQIDRSHSLSSTANEQVPRGGTISERMTEKEAPLFAPEMLGMLPNLEYIAILSGGYVVKGRYPLIV